MGGEGRGLTHDPAREAVIWGLLAGEDGFQVLGSVEVGQDCLVS